MSAAVKQLKDKDNNNVYPVTMASCTYMGNGIDTVERILHDQVDQSTRIEFKSNGDILKTLASGSTILIEFLDSGSITITTTNADGVVVQIKTISFNDDGTITITVNYEENEEGEE